MKTDREHDKNKAISKREHELEARGAIIFRKMTSDIRIFSAYGWPSNAFLEAYSLNAWLM